MKDVYVILAFHAHEMLWDLPERLLSYLDEKNPMREGLLTENYLKKRKEEGRDIYSLCSAFGDKLDAVLSVEYSNELLVQIKDVLPEVFERMKKDYARGRLYPLYGHAHHTHVSLLQPREISQEIAWNRGYLHNVLQAPYPKYNGLFPTEDSLCSDKLSAIEDANIDYVIFPHLGKGKVAYEIKGEGDCEYGAFWLETPDKRILALPRNFPISQEIWRPITKMSREEVKAQGYMLGDFAVFDNEYLSSERETYPISMEEGVAIYRDVLREELKKAPEGGLLLYVQDLELMDFGDIALEIMEKAWQDILEKEKGEYRVHFLSPDEYIDILCEKGLGNLPAVEFDKITWAPEIRLILRADGHYPPLGVTGVGPYDTEKTGIYKHPHIFWENGKYLCGIFDTLLDNFAVSTNVPVDIGGLGEREYDIRGESLDTQAVLYLRLMKRACNWGWRPTEGRQKRPCLLGFLLCEVLSKLLAEKPREIALKKKIKRIDGKDLVGICETLRVFIEGRINYLRYGIDEYIREKGGDFTGAYKIFESVQQWQKKALKAAGTMYKINSSTGEMDLAGFIKHTQEYLAAVYLATDQLQRVWAEGPDSEYLVAKMYHYLYEIYPPLFPGMVEKIDSMGANEIREYFSD